MINLTQHETDVLHQLNQLRENPSSFKDNFHLVAKALSRIPKKKAESRELDEVAKNLTSQNPIKALKLSPGLCLAAKDILNHMNETGKNYHIKLEDDDLKEHVRAYTKKFSKVFEIIDFGSVENILARSMISENDPQRTYKKAIFEDHYNFCGLASSENEEELTTIIIIADYIEEGVGSRTYNAEQFPEIKEAFDLFDINKIGKIDPQETKKAMRDLGFHIKNPMIYAVMDALDTPENFLGVNFDELMDEIINAVGDEVTKDGLYRIFCLYKESNRDIITLGGLKNIINDIFFKKKYY